MHCDVMLSVTFCIVTGSVVMLNVVMLSVVAPSRMPTWHGPNVCLCQLLNGKALYDAL